jgi:hypothetical protein
LLAAHFDTGLHRQQQHQHACDGRTRQQGGHEPPHSRSPRFAASHPHATASTSQTMAMNISSPIAGMDRSKAMSGRIPQAAKTAPRQPPATPKRRRI